jgi:hypothetical protein
MDVIFRRDVGYCSSLRPTYRRRNFFIDDMAMVFSA